jgi:hypothetical protein
LMNRDRLRSTKDRSTTGAIKPEGERLGISLTAQPPKVRPSFQPLGPGIVSEAIPAFYIGRNKDGFWVARNVNGKIGGIFLFESSALSFAKRKSRPKGFATIYQSETFELDIKNRRNPFIAQIRRLKRRAVGCRQRLSTIVQKKRKRSEVG